MISQWTSIKQGVVTVAMAGEELCDDGGQVKLVILVCLWHKNLPY